MTCQLSAGRLDLDKPLPCTPLQGLSRLLPEEVALYNRLHRRCAAWQGTLAGDPVTVTWACGGRAAADPVVVALTLGEVSLELRAPGALFERSGCGWLDESARAARTDSDAMLLELAWLSWIEPLETLLGAPLRVTGVAAIATPHPIVVPVQIRMGEADAMIAELHLGAEAAEQVAEWLAQHTTPQPDPLEALRLLLAVESAEAPLTLSELRSLQPGDVVMLDSPSDKEVRLRLLGANPDGQRFETRARRTGERLECLAPLVAVNPDRNDVMTELSASAPAAASDLDVALDDLPLKLVCQVGSVELTLAQLREMGPGSLLQLTSTAHEGVDLMVNGRRVGRGELVSIGDGLGVRLLGFNAP